MTNQVNGFLPLSQNRFEAYDINFNDTKAAKNIPTITANAALEALKNVVKFFANMGIALANATHNFFRNRKVDVFDKKVINERTAEVEKLAKASKFLVNNRTIQLGKKVLAQRIVKTKSRVVANTAPLLEAKLLRTSFFDKLVVAPGEFGQEDEAIQAKPATLASRVSKFFTSAPSNATAAVTSFLRSFVKA